MANKIILDKSGNGKIGVYDNVAELFYPNYYNNQEMIDITGWTSASSFVLSAFSDQHNGRTIFCSPNTASIENFKQAVYNSSASFDVSSAVILKEYVSRPPMIEYTGEITLYQDQLTLSGTDFYYDATYNVDSGMVYGVSGLSERWYFTSGVFGTCAQSISYTDPDTGRAGSIAGGVNINFKEFAIQPYAPKVWGYTTDEFRLDCDETSLTELNGNPTGSATLTHPAVPTFINEGSPLYHTAESTADFRESPPLAENVLSAVTSPYLQGNSNIFKPEETWGASIFFNRDGGDCIAMGRHGSAPNTATSIEVFGYGIYINMGGVRTVASINYTATGWNHLYWQNYYNGSAWVDDLYLNGVVVYTGRTTERGTTVSPLLPLFGGQWNVSANVDPDTDAQISCGLLSAIRIADHELNSREISGLFYRNYKVFLDLKNGDSVTAGYNGDPAWWETFRDESTLRNLKIESPNIAIGGEPFYNAMPVTPEAGFLAKGPFVTGSRPLPHVRQSCERMYEAFNPDVVTMSFTQNFVWLNYTEKNTLGTGSTGAPEMLGYNSYVDEFLYGHKSIEAYLTARDIPFFWGGMVPNNSTVDRTTDNVPFKDVLRICADNLLSDASNLPNVYHFHHLLRDTDNTWLPAYYSDGPHPNTAGMAVMFDQIEPLTFPRYEESRELYFYPKIEFIDPVDGDTVISTPYDITWTHDGTDVTDSDALTEGTNIITKEWTNGSGKSSSNSMSILYSDPSIYTPFAQYELNEIVNGNEFFDKSVNLNNATINGTASISGGRLLCDADSSASMSEVTMQTGHGLNEGWTHSFWAEKTNDTGVQYLNGILGSSFPVLTGCYVNGTRIELYIGGTFTGFIIENWTIASGRTHIVWQNYHNGSAWVVRVYINGVFTVDLPNRSTATDTVPATFGGKVDPSSGYKGYLDNYQFFKRTVSASDILAIYNEEL